MYLALVYTFYQTVRDEDYYYYYYNYSTRLLSPMQEVATNLTYIHLTYSRLIHLNKFVCTVKNGCLIDTPRGVGIDV